MEQLTTRRCAACTSQTPRVAGPEARALLEQTPGFSLDPADTKIEKTFEFENFHETMAFVNAVAWIAHREDHHPELSVTYRTCRVLFSTHAIGGLSENDFICAAKVNALL